MDDNEIRRYAGLMQELNLSGLEVGEGAGRLRLERSGYVPAAPQVLPAAPAASAAPAPAPQDGYLEVCSPMVGVFYSAPTENAAPYVSVGDRVKKGDVLCLIEAMKLMNEITAEQDGLITEICVGNNQVVDYGHVLFRMKKEPI